VFNLTSCPPQFLEGKQSPYLGLIFIFLGEYVGFSSPPLQTLLHVLRQRGIISKDEAMRPALQGSFALIACKQISTRCLHPPQRSHTNFRAAEEMLENTWRTKLSTQ